MYNLNNQQFSLFDDTPYINEVPPEPPTEKPADKKPLGEYQDVVHVSDRQEPPHTVNHPYYVSKTPGQRIGQDASDYGNDALFAAGAEDTSTLIKSGYLAGRQYLHTYSVPRKLMSTELFGDDYIPEIISSTPELWQSVKVTRKDAVENRRVVRYENAGEVPGKPSYIMPKSLIKSKDIIYKGVSSLTDDDEEDN